jgi:hypothetical protein
METRVSRRMAVIAGGLITAGVLLRLVPHVANFAPVGAIALFGGAVLPLRLAWWLPLAVMALSDGVIGLHDTILFTWLGFMLVGLYGMLWRQTSNWYRASLGAAGGATIFYVVSNFGVWAVGHMYAHTWQGLIDCYVAGVPFFRNSLAADVTYSAVLFGAYALVMRSPKRILANDERPTS